MHIYRYLLALFFMVCKIASATAPHIELTPPRINFTTTKVQLNQVAPLPLTLSNGSLGMPSSDIIHEQNSPPLSAKGQAVKFQINSIVVTQRRHALISQLTEKDLEQLVRSGELFSNRISFASSTNISAFERMTGVSTIKELFSSKKGALSLLGMATLMFVTYDITNTNTAVFEFKFFKEICGLGNYYPYLAMQNGNMADLAATGPSYLFMFPSLMMAYGAQCHDVCLRIISFIKRRNERSEDLYNPKNARLIKVSSVLSALCSGGLIIPKLYSLNKVIQAAGTSWGSNAEYFSYSYFFLLSSYTLFDTSTTYIHSKLHEYFNGDDKITAGKRHTLLNITQNVIEKLKGEELSDLQKIQICTDFFTPQANDTDQIRFYRMLFFLFDFGKGDLNQKPKEPKTRQAIRLTSEAISATAGYFSFDYIKSGVKNFLDDSLNYFGTSNESFSQVISYGVASIGSAGVVALVRNLGKSTTQVYDVWTGYTDIDEVASALYASTASGYTSHPRLRKYLTTFNKINGLSLGVSMGKDVFDISSSGQEYPAAILAGFASGALNTLFLQRWTHRLVNKIDGLKWLKSDKVGVMTDDVIGFVRDFRSWIIEMPAEVIQPMHTMAVSPGFRAKLMDRLQQSQNI